jgi:hypothetical protein
MRTKITVLTFSLVSWVACTTGTPPPSHPAAASADPGPSAAPSASVALEPTPTPPASASVEPVTTAAPVQLAPVVDLTEALQNTAFAPAIKPFKEGKWEEASATIERIGPTKLAHVPRYVGMAALAIRGRCHSKLSQKKETQVTYQKVLYRLVEPENEGALASNPGASDPQKAREFRDRIMASAEGEARYGLAEYKRLAAAAISPPKAPGPMKADAFQKFLKTKVVDWVNKKRIAADEAEAAYTQILEIKPSPPAEWVVAAGERVGTLRWNMVQEIRGMPTPVEWENSPDIKEAYKQAIDSASAPIVERARAAYQSCKTTSERFGSVPDHTKICLDWLASNAP